MGGANDVQQYPKYYWKYNEPHFWPKFEKSISIWKFKNSQFSKKKEEQKKKKTICEFKNLFSL